MKIWLAVLLTLFLCVSLGINVYLWISLKQHNDSAYKLEASYEHRLQHEAALENESLQTLTVLTSRQMCVKIYAQLRDRLPKII